MTYFKLGYNSEAGTDYSEYVSGVEIQSTPTQKAQTAASGLTKIDYQGMKHIVKVTFRPMVDSEFAWLQTLLTAPYPTDDTGKLKTMYIQVRFPDGTLTKLNVYIDKHTESYYTYQDSRKIMKKFTLTFKEL